MGWHSYSARGGSVSSYAEAAGVLKKRDTKKVANNTYVVRTDSNESLALLYHRTRIIHWHIDGSIKLNSGGWQTYSTKERLNRFVPRGLWRDDEWVGFAIQVWQQLGTWYVSIRTESGTRRTVHFQDGMVIHPLGQVRGHDGELVLDANVDADRREYLRRKSRERREMHRNGMVWHGRGRFGGWRQASGAPAPRQQRVVTEEERMRAEVERHLDNRDRLWRAAQMRKASGDPASPSYVPEFAKGNGKA